MATYASPLRQFSPYISQVNEDLYGKLLQKKELDYQTGVQKIEAAGQSVASLPIANIAARDLVQQKLDAITTQLNQNPGNDWSNQGLQKLTSQHISSIADDPTVQKAVASTVHGKSQYKLMNEDTDASNNKNVANKWRFQNAWHNYVNGDPNNTFQDDYVGYIDTDKWGDELMKTVKPHWHKIDNPAKDYRDPKTGQIIPAYQQWSKVTNSWEEIPENEVRAVLEAGIRNNPQIATQLSISADYALKDLTDVDYVHARQKVNNDQLILNKRAIQELRDIQLGIKPIPEDIRQDYEQNKGLNNTLIREMYKKQADELEKRNLDIENYDYRKDIEDFKNPANRAYIKNSLYKESWLQQKILQYGGKRKEEYTLDGDPDAKLLAHKKFEWDMKEGKARIDNMLANQKRDDDKFEWEKRTWLATHPGLDPTNPLVNMTQSSQMDNPAQRAEDMVEQEQHAIDVRTNEFLYYTLDPKTRDQLFKIELDNNGNKMIIAKPEMLPEISNYMKKYEVAYKTGNIGGVPLSDAVKNQVGSIALMKKSLNALKNGVIKDMRDATDNSPEGKAMNQAIENIENFVTSYNGTIGRYAGTISSKGFHDLIQKIGDTKGSLLNSLVYLSNIDGVDYTKFDPNSVTGVDERGVRARDVITELRKQYGTKADEYIKLFSIPYVRGIVNPSADYLANRSMIRNNVARQSQIVPQMYDQPLITGDEEQDKKIIAKYRPIVSDKLEGYKIANRVLSADKKQGSKEGHGPEMNYRKDPITGKEYLVFSDEASRNKGEYDIIEVDKPGALTGLAPFVPEPYTNDITRMIARSPIKSTYSYQPNWEESIPIRYQGDKETRIGFTYNALSKKWVQHVFIGTSSQDAVEIGPDGKPGTGTEINATLDQIGQQVDRERVKYGTAITR